MAKKHRSHRAHKGFLCVDCGTCTLNSEYYMVTDKIWAAVGMGSHDGMLCIGDLERRLGRELMAKDFTSCPLNKEIIRGIWPSTPRLLDRMQRI